MRIFIFRSLLSIAIVLFLLFLLRLFVPYYWAAKVKGSPILEAGLEDYRSKDGISTLFVGSSQIRHHIIPEVFDRITGLKSYNIGLNGMFFGECSYFLEHFLSVENCESLEYVILEIKPRFDIQRKNEHTERQKYFLDFKRTKLALRVLGSSRSYYQCYTVFSHYLGNIFAVGMASEILKFHLFKRKEFDTQDLGYSPLKNGRKFKKRFLNCVKIPESYQKVRKLIKPEVDRLRTLCEKKNIKLILFHQSEYDHCFISESNKEIYLGDFKDYEEFSDSDFWWNPLHLNHEGAIIFTEHFADFFITKVN